MAVVGFWGIDASAAAPEDAAARVVEQTNAFRQAQGLGGQAANPALDRAARQFARFMAETGKYGHRADGRSPAERAAAQGYVYCLVLENIGWIYRSDGIDAAALATALVEGWINSPEHRKNMLDPAATQTGVGVMQAKGGRYFAVQMFGRPKSAAIRFSVRNEATQDIDYRAGTQHFSLAPRATRTHTVCRPTELRITLPGQHKGFSDRPKDGASYTVTDRAAGLGVRSD